MDWSRRFSRRVGTAAALVIIAAVLPASPLAAQGAVNWTFRGPTVPISRIENAMVYDSANQRMVMFGGYDLDFNRTNDIWEYNGAGRVWTNVTPSSGPIPSARQGSAMAYDPTRQRILMFGGSDDAGTVLGDTWQWNTSTKAWTQLSPATSPPVRVGSRMVYDVANDRIVLQGGWNSTTTVHFADTWAWSPTTGNWTNLNSTTSSGTGRAFSQRTYHGFVYNTTNNRVTIFGGRGPAGDLNDLWELRGNVWTDITPAGAPPTVPAGRGWAGVSFESANNRILIYGGFSVDGGGFSFQDTWAFNGTWTQLANGPTPRDSHQMVWDPNRGVSVVFGGAANDVREFAANAWSGPLNQAQWPPIQDEHSIAFDPITSGNHRRIFLYGGGDTRVYETFGNNGGTLIWRSPWIIASGGPGGRIGHDMVYDAPNDRAILFGGRQRTNGVLGTTVFGDTWQFTRTPLVANPTWTSLAGGPPARYDHAMVYDSAHAQIVMFGGRNAAGTALSDTWIWNGSSWASAAAGPPARFGHGMVYDGVRGVVVLFGGDNGTQKLGDTWEWNGSSWTQRSTVGPPARSGPALAALPSACGGVLLFGGLSQSSTLLNDEWTWNGTSWVVSTAISPPSPRTNARMVFDPFEGRIWLFGGLTASGRSGEMWTATLPASGSFTVNDVSALENTTATFTVSLSPPQSAPASVSYSTADGTATAGSDYTATSGTLAFAACQATAVVSVPVSSDLVNEPDETFFLNLASPSGASIADSQGQGTIVNVFTPTADVSITKTDGHAAVKPGEAITYTIVASNPGPSTATGVTVTDTMPAAFLTPTWTCAAAGGGTCGAASGSGNINNTVTLPAGASVTFTVNGTISGAATGTVSNTASISAPGGGVNDPDLTNNSATDMDPVVTFGANNDTPSGAKDIGLGSTSTDTIGGPPNDQNWFRFHVLAGRSYCVEVDNGRSDVSIRDTALSVFHGDGSTVIGTNDDIADEPGGSLLSRVCYIAPVTEDDLARVTAGGTGSPGGFRIRAVETTLFCPWLGPLFSGPGFESFILIKNTTGTAHAATVTLKGAGGVTLGTPQSGTAPANGSYNLQVSASPPTGFGLSGVSGGVFIAHDGPPGALIANVTTLNFGSGVSYDTPAVPRSDFRP